MHLYLLFGLLVPLWNPFCQSVLSDFPVNDSLRVGSLEIVLLPDVGPVKIFSHSVGCRFAVFAVSFALQKLQRFRRSNLLTIALSDGATGIIFRKWSLVPMCSRLLPTFSSIRISMTEFMLRSLNHLILSYRYRSICNLLHVGIQF